MQINQQSKLHLSLVEENHIINKEIVKIRVISESH
ncbi:unnamed protein product [Paramecium octaurelia]|uniref:Uncharacterized protein n=1 Tax=Paramecium octaurelia TaxID=43137 RepID=A0A8S1VNJ2_PAROT|nr:unnamed protein product [Paramecium octaurelia]